MASAGAQVYVGGSIATWLDNNNDVETRTLEFLPEVGFSINRMWSIGTVLGFSQKRVESTTTYETFEFSPYARLSYFRTDFVRLFVDGTISAYSSKYGSSDTQTTIGIGFKPGVALDFSKKVSFVAKFGFMGYRQYDEDHDALGIDLSGNNLSIGFYYTF